MIEINRIFKQGWGGVRIKGERRVEGKEGNSLN